MSKRCTIVFDDETDKLVEDWRKQQDKIPSFNKAVNQIIRAYGEEYITPHDGKIEIIKEMIEDATFCSCDTYPHSPDCATNQAKEAKTE
jgi:hypothetical protein